MTNTPSAQPPSATQPTFTANEPPVWTITVNGISHLYREINGRLVRVHDRASQ